MFYESHLARSVCLLRSSLGLRLSQALYNGVFLGLRWRIGSSAVRDSARILRWHAGGHLLIHPLPKLDPPQQESRPDSSQDRFLLRWKTIPSAITAVAVAGSFCLAAGYPDHSFHSYYYLGLAADRDKSAD